MVANLTYQGEVEFNLYKEFFKILIVYLLVLFSFFFQFNVRYKNLYLNFKKFFHKILYFNH